MSQLGMYPSLRQNIVNHGVYRDVKRTLSANAVSNYKLAKQIRCLEANDEVDTSYKLVLLCVLNKAKQDRAGNGKGKGKGKALEANNPRIIASHCKKKGTDSNVGSSSSKEKEDPHYKFFLQYLKARKKSYAIEYEKDGLPVEFIYEEEPRMVTEQKIGTSIRKTRTPRKRKMTDTVEKTNAIVAPNPEHVPVRRCRGNKKAYVMNEGTSCALKPQVEISNEMHGVRNKNNRNPSQPIVKKTKVARAKPVAATPLNSCRVIKSDDKRSAYNAANKKPYGVNRKIQKRKLTTRRAPQNVRPETIPELNVPKKRGQKKLNRDIGQNVGCANDISPVGKLVNEAGKGVVENNKVGKTFVKEEPVGEMNLDSDVEILEGAAACVSKGMSAPFVSSKEYLGNEPRSEFRRRLLEHLGRPYDKEEGKRLREMVKKGEYFDHHPELYRKLTKFRYRPRKCLTILRGFVYWLQNVVQEGAFKPWKDGECLAVEPSP